MCWYRFLTKYTNIVLNIFSQTAISLDVRTVSSRDYFLRTVFLNRKYIFKHLFAKSCKGISLFSFYSWPESQPGSLP